MATDFSPYRYQEELAEKVTPPSVLEVPTGSGKTQAVLGAWLYQRLEQGTAPRRLVYALPMRTLVEQTRDVAVEMRTKLGKSEEELPIHVLMGGEDLRKNDWRLRPEANQILIGTIDMLLSRALNRGYGESRFAWPVSFGLLNADCRWVFDEIQLMGPARATSAQLDGLRGILGTALPCETMWVSATVDQETLETVDRPEASDMMVLSAADRKGKLQKRLTATKTLERLDLSGSDSKARWKAIAEQALERHEPGARTIVVLNRVEAAQAVYTALGKLVDDDGPDVVLLHSRFRPADREAHMARAIADPGDAGTIVVSTQVIEAGVDVSSQTLLTETAPFSSIVQRLGRCNREGDDPDARAVWLDYCPIEDGAAKDAAPYLPVDLNRARDALRRLEGVSLSPEALEGVEVEETPDDPVVLRRRDLVDLFDTSPDLSGMDIDIAPFIREDEERSVLVCFREIGDDNQPADESSPDRREVVQVPIANLKDRPCWKTDHVNRSWERMPGKAVPPGSTVILDAAEGGYTGELGWDGKSKGKVAIIELPEEERHASPETTGDNDQGSSRKELLVHLTEVHEEAKRLNDTLELPRWSEAITAAAALHDIGKAHPCFQALLRDAMGMEPQHSDGKLWAKSGDQDGERTEAAKATPRDRTGDKSWKRRYLRHELASMLALRSLDGEVELPEERELVTYLVAAHHGRVRLSIRPAPGEFQSDAGSDKRFALGIVEGDELPAVTTPLGQVPATTLDLTCMELGAEDSWTSTAIGLRDSPDLGPFRLAFLEAVLRIADWRASA